MTILKPLIGQERLPSESGAPRGQPLGVRGQQVAQHRIVLSCAGHFSQACCPGEVCARQALVCGQQRHLPRQLHAQEGCEKGAMQC